MGRKARLPAFLFSVILLMALSGCAVTAGSSAQPATYRSFVGSKTILDGRTHFREMFCADAAAVDEQSRPGDCEQWLWKLPDERDSNKEEITLRVLDHRIAIAIVGGAFGDCYPEAGRPFAGLTAQLRSQGYTVFTVPVSGRSSSEVNAQTIREFLRSPTINRGEPLILVGYSKGASDILELLADYPDTASSVTAVISVAGSVNGSPLAESYANLYDRYLSRLKFAQCPAGDGGVLDSLESASRLGWLASRPLPSSVSYYAIGSYASKDLVARGLKHFYRKLSRIDVRNDGQLLAEDQLIPGGTFLGYAKADHWAVALRIEKAFRFWGHRKGPPRSYPQDVLLHAALLFVQDDLRTKGRLN